ncbi:hypothetical protein LLEC1_00413 [Akanthomyces lecanii]|uniref:Rhodopsin domain-containing protein n=1 Tax=Cordyceps confragosa TaxID=2714763 RepID=A0A179I7M8_CORDF|nr:hypothetical protein LLEC1_00413 [Akanthomyces lecanii]
MIQPRELETPFNKSPLVRAVTAFLMVFSILAVITRIATRLLTAGSLKVDDHTVIAATALAVVQSIVVILQGANGFGQHDDTHPGQISYILKPAFWSYFEALNIATDLATIVAIGELVWNIQARKSMKSLVIFIFGSRLIIIPAAVCHIVYILKASQVYKSTNDTFEFWPPVIIRQVVQCLSIATACIPYLKPFLDNLESGQMRAGDALLYIKSGSGNSANKSSRSRHRKKTGANSHTAQSAQKSDGSSGSLVTRPFELSDIADNHKGAKLTTTIVHDDAQPSWDGQSQSSQTVLVQQSWRVDVEARQNSQV